MNWGWSLRETAWIPIDLSKKYTHSLGFVLTKPCSGIDARKSVCI